MTWHGWGHRSNTEAGYQDQFLTESEERSFFSSREEREQEIKDAREKCLQLLNRTEKEIDWWEGDNPADFEDPEADEVGHFSYPQLVTVEAYFLDDSVYTFTDGQKMPTREGAIA